MKNDKYKKQTFILSIILLCLILIAVGMSYAFLKTSFFGNKTSVLKVGSLSLILDETSGNAITVEDGTPMYDSEGVKQDNYFTFALKNNGTLDSSYTIYLEDQPLDNGDIRVGQSYVHYNLEKDSSVLPAKALEGDQAIDKGIIKKNQTINYKMRLWFASDIPQSEENKVFKAKLNVVGNQNIKMMASSLGLTNDEKNTVTKIVFQDSIKSIDNESKSWDISVAKNKTVMARLAPNTADNTTNTLYIQSDKEIFANYNCPGTFSNFLNLTSIENLSMLNTSSTTNLMSLFNGCKSLTDLDLSNFDTSNVTSMSYMFNGCRKLQNLNISSFNTSKVTDMRLMFNNCNELANVDISHFDTSKVTYMNGMFQGCSSLTNLDLSSFDTSKVTDMNGMFQNCSNLITLDLGNFNTQNVTNMTSMFNNCNSLTSLNISSFDTSNVIDMSSMFIFCRSLTELNVSNFDTSKVTTMTRMFQSCSNLIKLDVSNFNTSNVTNMSWMFGGCTNITAINVNGFNTSKVTTMTRMFYGCNYLRELDLSSFDTSNVTSMDSMFYYDISLTSINFKNADFSNVTSYETMFFNMTSLQKVMAKDTTAKAWLEDKLGGKGTVTIA